MESNPELEELTAFVHDSAIPSGGVYVLREDAVADTLWNAGYRRISA